MVCGKHNIILYVISKAEGKTGVRNFSRPCDIILYNLSIIQSGGHHGNGGFHGGNPPQDVEYPRDNSFDFPPN